MHDSSGPIHRARNIITRITLLLILASVSFHVFAAPKTDIIIFNNGDRLTGEIKSLQRGRLSFNTDATGTISIEWDKISNVVSRQYIQVEIGDGTRYFGNLLATDNASSLLIETESGERLLANMSVILMSPIDTQRVIRALEVDLTLGYNFAKAGGVKQGTIGIEVDYRTRKRIYSVFASTTNNDSNDQEQSTRANLEFVYRRLWQNRWYVAGNLNFDRNDELGLDLRSSLGANAGRYLIQSGSMLLDMQAGLQLSRENLIDSPNDSNSIEALFATSWDWFRFDSPELDWSTTFQLIPNLSDWGRVRTNFDTRLRWELFKDLKWGITFYSTYDNKTAEESSSNDYGVNTNVSYNF